ncbi:MAG: hypothetical protein RL217_2116 [Pseudomonadota bacterium]
MVLMWDKLLQLKKNVPVVHYLFMFTLLLNLFLLPFALMPSWVGAWLLVVVKFSNMLNSFNILVSLALLIWFWQRHKKTLYLIYFTAFIIPAVGLIINSLANLGYLPQTLFTRYFYQTATIVHVLVMSYGLALRLNQFQQDKVKAEQQAAAMAERASEQRRFVAMLSHEFRTPLAVIDRSAQMLQLKLADVPESEQKRLLQIQQHTAALFNLVDNFLITETLDNGRLPVAKRAVNICDFLTQLMEELGAQAQRVNVAVQEAPGHWNFDEHLIGMAVGNIVLNALKYSPAGSPVSLAVNLVNEDLLFTISDQGPGLSAEELALLGTPYFRADAALSKKGTGLGYYFSLRIVAAHGGVLRARSLPEQGFEVSIRLP